MVGLAQYWPKGENTNHSSTHHIVDEEPDTDGEVGGGAGKPIPLNHHHGSDHDHHHDDGGDDHDLDGDEHDDYHDGEK